MAPEPAEPAEPAEPNEPPRGGGFVPRGTPAFTPKRPRTSGRKWFILTAIAALLLGVVIGAWAAAVAVQQELRDAPAGSAGAGERAWAEASATGLGANAIRSVTLPEYVEGRGVTPVSAGSA